MIDTTCQKCGEQFDGKRVKCPACGQKHVIAPKIKKDSNPREKIIEKAVCDHATALGCLVYKFTSMGRRSVPDRVFILPGGKGVFFIEFKRRGEQPTKAQAIEIAKIQKQGTKVFVVDAVGAGKSLVRDMLDYGEEY